METRRTVERWGTFPSSTVDAGQKRGGMGIDSTNHPSIQEQNIRGGATITEDGQLKHVFSAIDSSERLRRLLMSTW